MEDAENNDSKSVVINDEAKADLQERIIAYDKKISTCNRATYYRVFLNHPTMNDAYYTARDDGKIFGKDSMKGDIRSVM